LNNVSLLSGLFSFFIVPILLGDITIDFMSMIDITVDITVNNTGTTVNNTNNNNNNNNNNNGGAAGGGTTTTTGTGNNNNNNNNNMNGKRKKKSIEGGANDLFGINGEICNTNVPD
jgi:hypothetical protein